MKKITKIKATGLKGSHVDYELGPVNLFTGPSMSGKTVVLDAIKLALLGWHPDPEIGSRPGRVLDLGHGPISVSATFDDGQTVRRSWRNDGRSSKAEGCETALVPPVLLDFKQFEKMTGPEQSRYIFSAIGGKTAFEVGPVCNAIKTEIGTVSPDTEETQAKILQLVKDLHLESNAKGETVPQWLETVSQKFKDGLKAAKAEADQLEKMVQASVGLKQEAPRSVETELERARKDMANLQFEIGLLRQQRSEYERTIDRRRELKQIVEYGTAELDYGQMIADASERLLEFRHVDTSALTREFVELSNRRVTFQQRLDDGIRQLAELLSKIGEINKLKCCPFCHSKDEGWRATLLGEYRDREVEMTMEIELNRQRVEDAQTALRLKQEELDLATKSNKKHQQIKDEIAELQSRKADQQTARLRWQSAKDELERLTEVKFDELEYDSKVEQLHARTALVTELEQAQKQWIAHKARSNQEDKAAKLAEIARAKVELWKLASKWIEREILASVDMTVGRLMEVANKFTDGILRGPLAYREGEIGYVRESKFVPSRAFSGTEKALVFSAMSVALCQCSEFKIVLIDELGVADSQTKEKILKRLVELVEQRVLDQAVLCDAQTPPAVDGVTVFVVK